MDTKMSTPDNPKSETSTHLHGVLAEFESVGPLMAAATQVRDAGYTVWDAHTPFPVHGLDGAMGVKPTRLPWLILLAGATGLICAVALQWWTNAFDYPYHISGKPLFSLPANIPVMFELTVLFSAFAAFFGTLALNKLPELFNPVFLSKRFRRATNDRFFIYVESSDPLFSATKLNVIFQNTHASALESIYWDPRSPSARLPKGIFGVLAVLTAVTLVPLGLIARAREVHSPNPRIHPIPDDMDSQPKFKAQTSNWFFSDGRSMRPPPEGTVAAEDTRTDEPFFTGKQGDAWVTAFPAVVTPTEQTMKRGHERFNIFCAPCHGIGGLGDGMVARHAERLMEGTWVTPTSLHEERIRKMAAGELFNTITHGIRNMPAYGPQIDEADRWAIIMYVRALQLSQNAPKTAVPEDVLRTLQ